MQSIKKRLWMVFKREKKENIIFIAVLLVMDGHSAQLTEAMRLYEKGWVQRRGGCWLLVLNGMWNGRQARRRRRQQPIHEYPQSCYAASCIRFLNKEPQWCPLLSWLAEAASCDAQNHVGGRKDGVCVWVCVSVHMFGGVARSWR